MDLNRLRQQTRADHEAVEGSVSLMQEDLSLESYTACLERMHGIIAAWEKLHFSFTPAWMQAALSGRRRLAMLESDLAILGVRHLDTERPALDFINNETSLAGAIYVMEGSTLGGQFIARHVEQLFGFSNGEGNAFFRGFEERTGSMWKELCSLLSTNVDDSDTESVVTAAKQMFQVYGNWMQAGKVAQQSLMSSSN